MLCTAVERRLTCVVLIAETDEQWLHFAKDLHIERIYPLSCHRDTENGDARTTEGDYYDVHWVPMLEDAQLLCRLLYDV